MVPFNLFLIGTTLCQLKEKAEKQESERVELKGTRAWKLQWAFPCSVPLKWDRWKSGEKTAQ